MKKKRKNKSMYLLLMLLLLASAGFATYAIYKTSATGSANVTAANWVVKVTANSTTTNVTGGSNNINLGACATHLAPGGSCTIPFTVDMSEAEVDSIVSVEVGTGIAQETLDLMTAAGITLQISDGTTEGYSYVLQYGTTKQLNLVIDWDAGDDDDDEKASADVAVSKIVGGLTIPVNMIVKQYNGEVYTAYTLGQEVYFDPTSDQTTCEAGNSNNAVTCMKWNVINTNDTATNEYLTLQLDHNLVNKINWVNKPDYNDDTEWENSPGMGRADKGPITALTSLATATSGWNNVDPLTYTYSPVNALLADNYGTLSCVAGTCTASKHNNTVATNVKARLITAEELISITKTQTTGTQFIDSLIFDTEYKNKNFYVSNNNGIIGSKFVPSTESNGIGNTNLSWLFQNTTNTTASGATDNSYGENNSGYWTLTSASMINNYNADPMIVDSAVAVLRNGIVGPFEPDDYDQPGEYMYDLLVGYSDWGARPVITIPKTKLQ